MGAKQKGHKQGEVAPKQKTRDQKGQHSEDQTTSSGPTDTIPRFDPRIADWLSD